MATILTSGNDGYIADGGEIVYAREGNDQIHIIHVDDSGGLGGFDFDYFAPTEVYGEQGDDYIVSFGWGDKLYGDSGNDTLIGGGGDDMLQGGSGDDVIHTGASLDDDSMEDGDTVWAGTGDDTVYLQSASHGDAIRGEDGYDTMYLYNGNGHISQFSLLAGGSNSGLLASGFEELHYFGSSGFEVIEGGNQDDWISGGGGTDLISALGGDDSLLGGTGADVISGGSGIDIVWGGDDDDVISGDDGNDTLLGEDGDDSIRDGRGNDSVSGGDGADTLRTGNGTDSVHGGDGNDIIREEGSDVISINYLGHVLSTVGGDKLYGDAGNDDIQGGSGHDTIDGGSGNDIIDGGAHVDVMTGGQGSDTFRYDELSDSGSGATRDTVTDFMVSNFGAATIDRIDLSAIDAVQSVAGNQSFTFIGSAGFSAEGQVRVVQQGDNAVVIVNTSGAGGGEMAIVLANFDASTINAADFIL